MSGSARCLRWLLIAGLVASAALSAVTVCGADSAKVAAPELTPASDSASGIDLSQLRKWKIAFERGNDIWVANGDGSGQKLVIRNGRHPCWSPHKKLIAFERDDNVWLAQADGTHQRALTRHRKGAGSAYKPSSPYHFDYQGINISWNRRYNIITFSHPEAFTVGFPANGTKIRVDGCAMYDIFLPSPGRDWDEPSPSDRDLGIFGRNAVARIAPGDHGAAFVFGYYGLPAWSHSGKYLAYSCNGDLWLMRNEDEQVTNPPVSRWTNARLATVAVYDAGNDHASRMNVAVSRISWSPDDRVIVYSLSRQNGSGWDEIHVLKPALPDRGGWSVKSDMNLSDGNSSDGYPCFCPDGRHIAYTRMYDEVSIWVMTLDGKNRRRLIADASYAAW